MLRTSLTLTQFRYFILRVGIKINVTKRLNIHKFVVTNYK